MALKCNFKFPTENQLNRFSVIKAFDFEAKFGQFGAGSNLNR